MLLLRLRRVLLVLDSRFGRGGTYVLYAILTVAALLLQVYLFGFGATRRGGQLGRFLDNAVRRSMFERAVVHHTVNFETSMGYAMPEHPEHDSANKVGVSVLLNSWLSETLIRTQVPRTAVEQHATTATTTTACPMHIIQPNVGNWYRPIEWELAASQTASNMNETTTRALVFDENLIAEFMMDHFGPVYQSSFYQKATLEQQIQLFGMFAVYEYGGIFVHPEIRNEATLHKQAPALQTWLTTLAQGDDCTPAAWMQTSNSESIRVLAATPKHPRLKCVINEVCLSGGSLPWDTLFHLLGHHTNWDPTCEPRCCPLQNLSLEAQARDVYKNVVREELLDNDAVPRFQVTVREKRDTPRPTRVPKDRCSDRLRSRWCAAGWLCNRCLRMPFKGSLEACRFVCRPCYKKTVCIAPKATRTEVTVEVTVKERKKSSHKKRIPRIIHQTWFEDLATSRYPHLQRLQNSWKASGWEYRFYTDEDCVAYIARHYPQRFVDAYDAILPGAFKADFFRLLVLFQDGGIYADIDVQLGADLDYFITKDLSFFVPRDVPLDYWHNSNYCLWNGLMGAAPGNPIIAKAIEDVLSTILNRVDYYDVEGGLCARDPATEIWKLRTLPILILTGPCALGMSVNAALGKENLLQGHDLGWLEPNVSSSATSLLQHEPANHFWGDSLTLLADRYDLGELRFTDVDRNLAVASSNQDRIAKSPIETNGSRPKKTPVHYSKSETDIVGEYATYKDSQTANEQVVLKIRHEYV